MQVKILITDPISEILINKLTKYNIKIDYRPDISKEELQKIIYDYDVIVVRSRTRVDKELIEKGKKLKVIARAGIGVDNIDTEEAEKRNIRVVYAPGTSTDSAAELTIGLMIAAARNLYNAINLAKTGVFKKIEGVELAGKTIGIIGFGRIGSKVATVANALGMKVLAYDILDIKERALKMGAEPCTLDDMLPRADIITLHVTVGKETKYILDREQFEKMKNNVIIVNTSRAAVVNGKILLEFIRKGKIFAYATDVFWNEPPKEEWEYELLRHERVIVTPHIGAQTKEAQDRVAEVTAQNLINVMKEMRLI
ncbi:NAD(P)-dependent oxidoreductase [Sulfolobus acidocaldarius]|uniref:D-isomer specific 2-hydroxyacid dehydrogenase n=4 Tax=Sulfolobus acidocaldarius TaxID=2285 RepID=Q4J928_SULAC|nr:NAD(P)-dependent oxidoreductase [Sulfolobus acidocaldarius]AAY80702.1 D-isomer specific 2-hydroxyacid dehydrogenase [Sulfolobus acidocaldarius DSM 639]AGE73568.1 D-isomer specific 2-hydroxyacid dehydrogenase [Sulfolobus acidocaldarius Ron12/I]ALU30663.1 3-phosphoglycerate dehydrogenase [Sulfolobus acidocaldarius]ALU32753.1 3-phosphoglycerate dehydrogenase [Sulfolobus acidocaldarius]WCM35216.1 3-phosphoglycerate dehydrogenase [Sulfolobus acidocaldarius DSM 639]